MMLLKLSRGIDKSLISCFPAAEFCLSNLFILFYFILFIYELYDWNKIIYPLFSDEAWILSLVVFNTWSTWSKFPG